MAATRDPPAVSADGLTKRYGDRAAVRGVTFAVPRGTVFGFLGPNGAGKTTTVRLLLGFLRPTAGTATVGGFDPAADPMAVRRLVGYLPEAFGLYEDMTAHDLLAYAATLQGVSPRARERSVTAALRRFGLADRADSRVGTFSKGMRQKLGLARAIVHDPRILFLDEPTSGLDPEAAREVRRLLLDLKGAGRTIFVTTHVLPEAERVCDVVGFLKEGQLLLSGTVGELLRHAPDTETLEDLYFEVVAGEGAPA